MPHPLDWDDLRIRARRWLVGDGLTAAELARRLGVSQPSVSRLLSQTQEQLLRIGKARRTRYCLRRPVDGVTAPVSIYEVDAGGQTRKLAQLHPFAATRYYVESCSDDVDTAEYQDWPWWLHQLRPAGFLGRHVASRHPELGLPDDPRGWSGDQVLRYLNRHGSNGSGALIVGEPALAHWLSFAEARLPDHAASELYPSLVDNVLAGAPPGSSAEGEQPKFLVARTDSRPERLVKFSPPLSESAGRRIADLLLAEHHALETLKTEGIRAATSVIVEAGARVFLEAERFDRTPRGRVGFLSLEPIELEFDGRFQRNHWPSSVRRLIDLGRLPTSVLETVQQLHAFGHLIGNNDMHAGNLGFVVKGERVLGIAPTYDMAPMQLAPRLGEPPPENLRIAPDSEVPRGVWEWAWGVAQRYFREVAADERLSDGFRRIADNSASLVADSWPLLRRLPT